MRNSFLLLAFLFVLAGCSSSKKAGLGLQNSINSNSWQGTYRGLFPCADCSGINVVLSLNEDQTFRLKTQYLDVEGEDTFVSEGSFEWDDNGQIIWLKVEGEERNFHQYLLEENQLVKLNSDGKRAKGKLSEMYILKKQDDSLFGKKFVLSTLNDKSIDSGEVFITFDEEENRFYGKGGCNLMNGNFLLKGENKLSLSQVIYTKMACHNVEYEMQFFMMLGKVNAYELNGDTLIFKDEKTVLAVFKAE